MNQKVVAFVPIKMNSQRLPNKNILPLMDKPMCWHIFNTLTKVKYIDELYVFCSDEKIKEFIPPKVKFLKRNKQLDEDYIKGEEIYKSFINSIDSDLYVLAHTTSPFTKADSIIKSVEMATSENYDSAFSAKKIQTFAWYKNNPINYKLDSVPRTQDIEPIFVETSAFYMFTKEIFTKLNRRIGFKPYIHEVDFLEGIDIDTKADYELAKIFSNL